MDCFPSLSAAFAADRAMDCSTSLSARIAAALAIPSIMALGRGGHPGTNTSTGIWLLSGPATIGLLMNALHGGGTGSNRNHCFWMTDLSVDRPNGAHRIIGHRSGDAKNVAVPGTSLVFNAHLLNVEARCQAGDQFNIATITASRVHMEQPRAPPSSIFDHAFNEVHRIPRISAGSTVGQRPPNNRTNIKPTITAHATKGSLTVAVSLSVAPHQYLVRARV